MAFRARVSTTIDLLDQILFSMTNSVKKISKTLCGRLRNYLDRLRHRHVGAPPSLACVLRDWLIAITACLSIPALVYTYYGVRSARVSNRLAEQDLMIGLREQCSSDVCSIVSSHWCGDLLTYPARP